MKKFPGFCVKAQIEGSSAKFFINFCHSITVNINFINQLFYLHVILFFSQISPPTLILSESDLKNCIERENFEELSKFSVPLIVEKLDTTKDKKGVSSRVSHVIVNSKFYTESIATSDIYQSFLVYVTIEILNAKFNLKIDQNSYVILKNKLYQLPDNQSTFNKFISHQVDSNIEKNNSKLEIIDNKTTPSTTVKEPDSNVDSNSNVRMSLDCKNDLLEMAIKLNDTVNFEDLSLLINDDRVVIKYKDQVLNDFHTSVTMNADRASSSFKDKVLRIKCPVFL